MKLKVEIASRPHELEKGLMFRKSLNDDSGMLFVFSNSGEKSFWGRNTLIPLDIAFIDSDMKISKIDNINPMSEQLVKSCKKCIMAIEANANFFNSKGIKEGDCIKIEKINDKLGSIIFTRT